MVKRECGCCMQEGDIMGSLLKKLKKNVVISALLCIVLGLVLAIWSGMSMHIVCTAIGSVLILGGLIRLAESFFDRDGSMYTQMNMIVGIIFAVVGIWIVIKPEKVLAIIPIIVCYTCGWNHVCSFVDGLVPGSSGSSGWLTLLFFLWGYKLL